MARFIGDFQTLNSLKTAVENKICKKVKAKKCKNMEVKERGCVVAYDGSHDNQLSGELQPFAAMTEVVDGGLTIDECFHHLPVYFNVNPFTQLAFS
ncbi:hypothetical protein LXL04_029764 [Taraxacum kok-saghyz]